jgi:hypothetical protein
MPILFFNFGKIDQSQFATLLWDRHLAGPNDRLEAGPT